MIRRWPGVFSILLVFVFVIGSLSCALPPELGGKSSEYDQTRQAISKYIDEMTPALNESVEIMKEYNSLTMGITANTNPKEVIMKLYELGRRENEVYHKVSVSGPPIELRDFRLEWTKQCQLRLQVFGLIIRAMNERDASLITEAQKLNSQANTINIKKTEQLQDILRKYGLTK